MTPVIVYAPYHSTGGVEALHQLAEALPSAELRYWPPLYEYLAKYPSKGTRVVVPEIWPDLATTLRDQGCEVFFWHLGVSGSMVHTLERVHHLACGEYVFKTCLEYGIEPRMLTDYIGPVFHRSYDASSRRPGRVVHGTRSTVAMNGVPRAGVPMDWRMLTGLRQDEVARAFRSATVYYDAQPGGMPGRDRMPREAALCGCYPVILRAGAACTGDVPYIETYPLHALAQAMEDALSGRVDMLAFHSYQEWIRDAEKRFREEVHNVFVAAPSSWRKHRWR